MEPKKGVGNAGQQGSEGNSGRTPVSDGGGTPSQNRQGRGEQRTHLRQQAVRSGSPVEYGSDESLGGDEEAVEVCGFVAYNDNDGEWYTCGLPAHGPKVKHGAWVKQ